jgi:hypothetical protein
MRARNWKLSWLAVIAAIAFQMSAQATAQVAPGNVPLPCGVTVGERERVRELWVELRGGFRASAANPANFPTESYNMQIYTDAVLTMARYCNDSWLLDQLASYYLLAVDKLTQHTQGYWFWADTSGNEVVLESSQFLAGVADLYHTLMSRPRARRSAAMEAFVTQYQPVLKSHLTRWIWQRASMWTWSQCGLPAGTTWLQAYPFEDFVRRRRNNCGPEDYSGGMAIAVAKQNCLRHQFASPRYCNAMLEIELFVAQAGADFVSADDSQAEFPKLTTDERTRIANYVSASMALWESRLVQTTFSNARCGTVSGYLVDPAGMQDHPTYSGWGTTPTAWDLSHGRRFVRFLDTMERNIALSNPTISLTETRARLANMVACKIWAADNSMRFSNFIDGSNPGITLSGTYYAPWSMSHSYMGGGFAGWSRSNSLLGSVNGAILQALNGEGDHSTCEPPSLPANGSHTLPYCFFTVDALNFRASLAAPPTSQQPWQVSGDWNGDGRADLFIHNTLSSGLDAGKSRLFLSSATGYTPVNYPTAPGYDSQIWKTAGIADFTGDGRTDLMIHAELAGHPDNGKTFLYRSNSDGSNSVAAYPTTPGWDAAVWESFVADFSGDGIADVLLHGKLPGSAEYGQTILLVFQVGGTYVSRTGSQVPTWAAPWKAQGVADFNGDGRADLLLHAEQAGHAENGRTRLHLFTHASYLSVGYPETPGFDSAVYEVKGTGDFDGDGRADLFVHGKAGTSVSGQTLLYLFDEDGSTRSVNYPATPGFDSDLFVVRGIADFDGDGRSDILIHAEHEGFAENGRAYLFLYNEWATNYRTVAYPTTPGWDAAVFDTLPPLDWNGDGRADLVIHGKAATAYSGQTYIYLFNSDGTYSTLSGPAVPSFVSPPWMPQSGR